MYILRACRGTSPDPYAACGRMVPGLGRLLEPAPHPAGHKGDGGTQAEAGNQRRQAHRGPQQEAKGQNRDVPQHADRAGAQPAGVGRDQLRNRVVRSDAQIHHHVKRGGNQKRRHADCEQHNSDRHGQALRRNMGAHQPHGEVRHIADAHHIGNGAHADAGEVQSDDREEHQQVKYQLACSEGDARLGGDSQREGGTRVRPKPDGLEHRHADPDYDQADGQNRYPAPHAGPCKIRGNGFHVKRSSFR